MMMLKSLRKKILLRVSGKFALDDQPTFFSSRNSRRFWRRRRRRRRREEVFIAPLPAMGALKIRCVSWMEEEEEEEEGKLAIC